MTELIAEKRVIKITVQDQFSKKFKVKISNKNSEKQPAALLGMIVHDSTEDWH